MAAPGPWTKYHGFLLRLGDGTFDLNSNTFKVALIASGYTPVVATHVVFADVTNELATANGYTAGGAVAANPTYTLSGGVATFDTDNVSWTASGAGITARYAVLYAVGTLNGSVNPLVAYMLLDSAPADVATSATNTLTINIANVMTVA